MCALIRRCIQAIARWFLTHIWRKITKIMFHNFPRWVHKDPPCSQFVIAIQLCLALWPCKAPWNKALPKFWPATSYSFRECALILGMPCPLGTWNYFCQLEALNLKRNNDVLFSKLSTLPCFHFQIIEMLISTWIPESSYRSMRLWSWISWAYLCFVVTWRPSNWIQYHQSGYKTERDLGLFRSSKINLIFPSNDFWFWVHISYLFVHKKW
jgi:hypothetical protein